MDKRTQMEAALPEAKRSAAFLASLPKAAAMYRQKIDPGLDGDPRALQRRVRFCGDFLREGKSSFGRGQIAVLG